MPVDAVYLNAPVRLVCLRMAGGSSLCSWPFGFVCCAVWSDSMAV